MRRGNAKSSRIGTCLTCSCSLVCLPGGIFTSTMTMTMATRRKATAPMKALAYPVAARKPPRAGSTDGGCSGTSRGVVPFLPSNRQLTRSFVASTGWRAIQAHVITGPSIEKPPAGVSSTSSLRRPSRRVIVCASPRAWSYQISCSTTDCSGARFPVARSTTVKPAELVSRVIACSTGSSPIAAIARSTSVRWPPFQGATSAITSAAARTTAPASTVRDTRRLTLTGSRAAATASASASNSGSSASNSRTS